MGLCQCNSTKNLNNKNINSKITDFKKIIPIGKGGYGIVWKVQNLKNLKIYALKEMSKIKLYQANQINPINYELKTLTSLKYPFISNIHYAFQTKENLYMIIDYLPGGDLRYHMLKRHPKNFTEQEIKFIVSNILLSLKYLRTYQIIHRDIKPDNMIFDSMGYIHLTDFNISKNISKNDDTELNSGTIGYVSPELFFDQKQSFQSDYFSLGVVLYELIFCVRPFQGDDKKTYRYSILYNTINLKENNLPKGEYIDKNNLCLFLNRLLDKKDESRLGGGSIDEVLHHPWLKDVDWDMIENRKMSSPFLDECKEEIINYQCENIKDLNENINSNDNDVLNFINQSKFFKNYYYDEDEVLEKYNNKDKKFKNNNNMRNSVDVNTNKNKKFEEINNYNKV